jgi:hypothetical protein
LTKQHVLANVINPYALAELIQGKRIRWSRLPDAEAVMARALGLEHGELFDPQRSPLYMTSQDRTPQAMDAVAPELRKRAEVNEIEGRVPASLGRLLSRLRPNAAQRVSSALFSLWASRNGDFTPADSTWSDRGDFFEEAAEYFDPLQGATADCYLISGLSSIAWARPYVIAQRSRPTGDAQDEFKDMITFFSGGRKDIEVTERVPVNATTHQFLYARSSESNEIWPAIYEKAYAKLKAGSSTDKPNIPALIGNGGSPLTAMQEVTGLSGEGIVTSGKTEDELWQLVRAHSLSYRTVDPMTACTYPTNEGPGQAKLSDANIVAWHCYSILGWAYVDKVKYIVLRNPWGTHEATLHNLAGSWAAYNISFWQNATLNQAGVFAFRASSFNKYFASVQWVK